MLNIPGTISVALGGLLGIIPGVSNNLYLSTSQWSTHGIVSKVHTWNLQLARSLYGNSLILNCLPTFRTGTCLLLVHVMCYTCDTGPVLTKMINYIVRENLGFVEHETNV